MPLSIPIITDVHGIIPTKKKHVHLIKAHTKAFVFIKAFYITFKRGKMQKGFFKRDKNMIANRSCTKGKSMFFQQPARILPSSSNTREL